VIAGCLAGDLVLPVSLMEYRTLRRGNVSPTLSDWFGVFMEALLYGTKGSYPFTGMIG
jgi:hypothetical protein